MTVCTFCLDNLAPRSEQQLKARRASMAKYPDVKVSPCPHCAGTEYATTAYAVDLGIGASRPRISAGLFPWVVSAVSTAAVVGAFTMVIVFLKRVL